MRVLFAAGGTGGHIFPALAIAAALGSEDSCSFVGVGRELEEKLIAKGAGHRLDTIPFVALSGRGVVGLIKALLNLPIALYRGVSLICELRPDVVIAFGGYPSFIPFAAALLCRVPRVLHEQNVQVGLANKMLSRLANYVFATTGAKGFPAAVKVTHLPNPVRKEISAVPDLELPAAGEPLHVAVLGGSQGAVSLNTAVLGLIPLFKKYNVQLIHQAGARDSERVAAAYRESDYSSATVSAFIEDIAAVYRKAHLIICRAGALTVAEVAASGRPAVYVPLPIAGGHQKENAAPLVAAGAAVVVAQDEAIDTKLESAVAELLSAPEKLLSMAQAARGHYLEKGVQPTEVIVSTLRQNARLCNPDGLR